MIALALMMVALPASLDRIAQRLDCDVHHHQESATGDRRSVDLDQFSNRIFLLLPADAKDGSGKYLSIVTMDDGRSWFSPGKVDRREGKIGPEVNVSIDGGTGLFTSDRIHLGVVHFRQRTRIYDTTDVSIMEAACKLMPDAKDRNAK